MRLELQVKVSCVTDVPLVSRIGPVVIELLLIQGQQEENGLKKRTVAIQCYYRNEYGTNGYRKIMHVIWNEMRMFNVTEQRLIHHKNNILKRKWLSDLELDEIQRNIKEIGHGEVGLENDEDEAWFLGFDHEGRDVFMKECNQLYGLHGAKC